ncbi:MAG: transglutaminase-like domain-containing protein [Promethearchaeota archaeon]
MVKQFVAGIWDGLNPFLGFSYSTSLPIDGCAAYFKGKIPMQTIQTKTDNDFKIEVEFPKPIIMGEKYVYELQFLLNRNNIDRIGPLNIFEWPKENLTEIVFLRNAGKIFFSSALAKIIYDSKEKTRKIIPGTFAKSLVSHASKSSSIRIEWGKVPTYRIYFNYEFYNFGIKNAKNIEFSSYIPPSTKFQSVINPKIPESKLIKDEDNNSIINFNIESILPGKKKSIKFYIDIQPRGNIGVMLPNFGKWIEYKEITKNGSLGEKMLSSSSFWPLSDPEIRELITVLKSNSINASSFIKLAFEFVNRKITYETNGFRDNAANALHTRKGDCSEISDLFVSILRGGGIPARIVHGWTINPDKNSLNDQGHAWCEFFSPSAKTWRQCDPTWGFLTGVSCQHICRQREGVNLEQNTFFWRYKGETELDVEESISYQVF